MCVRVILRNRYFWFELWQRSPKLLPAASISPEPWAHQDAVTSDAPSSDGLHWPGDQEEVTAGVTSPAFLYPAAASQGQQENGSLYWMRERADTLGNVGRKPLLVSHFDVTFLLSQTQNQFQTNKNRGPIGTMADNEILWATTTTPHHPVTFMPVNG